MRGLLGNVIRGEYADIVSIVDHKDTTTQCLGDKLLRKKDLNLNQPKLSGPPGRGARVQPLTFREQTHSLTRHRPLWQQDHRGLRGRAVPGSQSCLYFWNLPHNREGRPVAGLSSCNLVEATAVVQLTAFLILCGIPPDCISIITPYKGQVRAIIKAMQAGKHGAISSRARQALTVSTVDRYQGDENDVVILSLVKTSPGNRFIGLANRLVICDIYMHTYYIPQSVYELFQLLNQFQNKP